jgi:hypothetical protein
MTKRKSTSRKSSSKKSSKTNNKVAVPSTLSSTLSGAGSDMNNQIQKSGKHVLAGALFPGSVSDAYIAGSIGETFEVKPDAMKATLMSSAECLDTLAFYALAVEYWNELTRSIRRPAGKSQNVDQMILDERVPIMISSAISRAICILLRSAPHELQKIDGKQRAVVTFEDFFSFLVKNFSNNVVLFEKGSVDVASNNINLSKYELEVVMADIRRSAAWSKKRSAPAFVVDETNVGKTFSAKIGDGAVDGLIVSALASTKEFLSNLNKKFKFVSSSDTLGSGQINDAFAAVLVPIVFHVLAFTYVQPFDFMFKAYDATGDNNALNYAGMVYHRATTYPSLIAVMGMYGINEKTVDEAVHALQMRITEVRKLFQKARDAYDEKPKTMRIHESEPAPSSYLQSEADRMNAQKLHSKMLHVAQGGAVTRRRAPYGVGVMNAAGAAGAAGVIPPDFSRGTNINRIVDTYGELQERGVPVSAYFGRRRRRSAAFGKKKRRSAAFGKARKGKKRSSFGKRRRSGGKKRRSAAFGKKRRSAGRR